MHYFYSMFQSLVPYISDNLISSIYLNKIEDLIISLSPGFGLRTFGFELPLASESKSADFMISSRLANNGPDIILSPVYDQFHDRYYHDTISRFMRLWEINILADNPSGPLDDVCFEYDLMENPSIIPEPCVFFNPFICVDNLAIKSYGNKVTNLMTQINSYMMIDNYDDDVLNNLENCIDVVKGMFGVKKIIIIGMMISRNANFVRMVVNIDNINDIIRFLNAINWPGKIKMLCQFFNIWSKLADRFCLNINIGKEVDEKIGFELSFRDDSKNFNKYQWEALLGYCVEMGYCNREIKSNLLNYQGYSLINQVENNSTKIINCPLLNSSSQIYLIRRLFHLKITYPSSSIIYPKIYLSATPYFTPSLFQRVSV